MRWHLRNYNCKHIVLGISHDAGYAPFLDEVMTADDRNKISILEGPPTVYELKTLGLPIISYTDIFRTEKPVDRVQPVESASQAPPSGVNITASKTSTAASSPATTWAGITTAASTLSISPAGTEVPPVISIKNARGAVRPPEWVPEPRGLDPFVTPNLHSLADIKRKTGSEKLCNNYFLRGACSKGNECPYKHRPKLGEDDLNALAYLSRLNPCQQGQYCPDYTCVYGHHCPAYKLEKKSNGEMAYYCRWYCKFDEEGHPPGTIMSYAQ